MMVAFIDRHHATLGIGSICRTLQFVPSAYYERKRQSARPEVRSPRQKADESLRRPYSVYGKTISESMAPAKSGANPGGKAMTWPVAPLSA